MSRLRMIPLRAQLTIVCTLVILICSIGLTALLNHSANTMADAIEALPTIHNAETGARAPSSVSDAASSARNLPGFSQGPRHTYLLASLCYLGATVLIGAALSWIITGRALQPLRELSEHMTTRTAENLADRVLVPPGDNEAASLAASFNIMSARLEQAFAAQKRFSQSAAHELRTPLAILTTKLEVYRKKSDRTDAEREQLLDSLGMQIARLSRLVGDLLNLTSMEDIACDERIDAAKLLNEVAAELSARARHHGTRLSVSCEDIELRGNASLLHRAVADMVENALDHGGDSAGIRICGARSGATVRLSVADRGPGISDACKQLIFEPFYRGDASRSSRRSNVGLGLATVRSVAAAHGGTVEVADNPGGGSVFTLVLPLR